MQNHNLPNGSIMYIANCSLCVKRIKWSDV